MAPDGKAAAAHRGVTRANFTQGASIMNNILSSALSKFVCAAVATVMTSGLAWMVVDSTSNGPNDDIVILHADVWSQIHVEA
jgi:hypothetical protein